MATEIFYTLASTITYPHAIDTLIALRDPKLDNILASNPNLSTAQRALIHKTATVATATALATSAVGDSRLRPLLKDSRQAVRYALFVKGFPGASDELLEEITSGWLTRSDANFWLESGYRKPPKHLLKKVARAAFYQSSFGPMADPEVFSLTEAQDLLSKIVTRSGETKLSALTDRRPELLPYIIDMVNGSAPHNPDAIPTALLLTALVTSRHIFDQQLLSSFLTNIKALRSFKSRIELLKLLGRNPNLEAARTLEVIKVLRRSKATRATTAIQDLQAIYELKLEFGHQTSDWSQIQDPEQLARIAKMVGNKYNTTPHGSYPTMANTIPALPTAPAQSKIAPSPIKPEYEPVDLSKRYLAFESGTGDLERYKLREATFNNQVAPVIDPLGKAGWDLFISLSLSWSASVSELLDATLTTLS